MSEHDTRFPASGDPRVTVSVFAGTMAIVVSGLYLLARVGFPENPSGPVLKTLAVSLFLIFLPHAADYAMRSPRRTASGVALLVDPLLSLAGLLLLSLAGLLASHTDLPMVYLFSGVGVSLSLWVFWKWLGEASIKRSLLFLGGTALFSCWVASELWGHIFQNPLSDEEMLVGKVFADSLCHPAIANMVKTFGIPSDGLDGVKYFPYHFGSHWLLVRLSEILGLSIFKAYGLGFPAIIVPLFFRSLLLFAVCLRKFLYDPGTDWNLRSDAWFWLLLAIANIGVLPEPLHVGLGLGRNWHLSSESQALGLMLAFLALSASVSLFFVLPRLGDFAQRFGQVVVIGAVPLLLCVIGWSKVAPMCILLPLFLFIIWRFRLYKRLHILVSALVAVAACLMLLRLVSPPLEYRVFPFHILWAVVEGPSKALFPLFYFLWAWIFISMRVWVQGLDTWQEVRAALTDRRLLDIEVVIVTCLLSVGPGVALAIPWDTVHFFGDFQRWLSLGFLMGYVGFFAHWFKQSEARRDWLRELTGLAKPKYLFLSMVFLTALATVCYNIASSMFRAVRNNLEIRAELVAAADSASSDSRATGNSGGWIGWIEKRNRSGMIGLRRAIGQACSVPEDKLRRLPGYKTIEALKQLGRSPIHEKRKTLLFIPRSNVRYWNISDQCRAVPYIAPGLTGMAMIEGLPDERCEPLLGYTFEIHQPKHLQAGKGTVDKGRLCARCLAEGFENLTVLEMTGDGNNISVIRLSCEAR
ncbi:MAG: hypothetical protein HY914_04075 [Desulfomonile tiedjei]|nr:hypothetical protein [Desulfomonile tiedjei]